MNDFSIMNETVDIICESLENTPENWEFDVCTLSLKNSGIMYWDSSYGPITEQWIQGSARIKVFSSDQGWRIRDSLNIAKAKIGTKAQQNIINTFKNIKKI